VLSEKQKVELAKTYRREMQAQARNA